MAEIINGKEVSTFLRNKLKEQIREEGLNPGLAVIIVGEDPASKIYVRNKHRACEEVGIYSEVYALTTETTEEELLKLISELNEKKEIHGILVQMPLPKHINSEKVINAISPLKDVDAFHPVNVGKIMGGSAVLLPCTPAGVMELLKYYNIDVAGKNCVVIGRSDIVGKPMAMLLLHANATVTICHSKTRNLADFCRNADVLVSAVGRTGFVTEDMVKEGAVVIDVGINRDAEGKVTGDVDFENVSKKASYITPVPGGVGPMTITMLMRNAVTASKNQ